MKRFVLLLVMLAVVGSAQAQTSGDCGCIDLVLVVDNTASMGPAINNVKAGLSNIVASAELVSGQDLRMGLVTFPEDNPVVNLPMTNDVAAITNAVAAIAGGGGGNIPEASDESLKLVVTGAASAECTVSEPNGPLGFLRFECLRIAVLVTDATPGGCHDSYTDGVDDTNAFLVATAAKAAGIRISAILVGSANTVTTNHPSGVENDVMMDYAAISGGVFKRVAANGIGTSDAILDILSACGQFVPPPTCTAATAPTAHTLCITRNARYWLTHPNSDDPTCVTLLRAIDAASSNLCLGYLNLPVDFRNSDNVKDSKDALIEALGLYWQSSRKTGEERGTQSAGLPISALGRERKRLAVELIAAEANNTLLGTHPTNCTFVSGGVVSNFPADLIERASDAAAGEDIAAIRAKRTLLHQFNSAGLTNAFPAGFTECSPASLKLLRSVSRDPTTQVTGPGLNDFCESALSLLHFPHFERLDLGRYHNNEAGPKCAIGGAEAVWRISPPVAANGRQFVVEITDNNFLPVVSVRRGRCSVLQEITCGIGTNGAAPIVNFTTDGSNTYWIVTEGVDGAVGTCRFRVISY